MASQRRGLPGLLGPPLARTGVPDAGPYVWRDRDADRDAEVARQLAAIRAKAAARVARQVALNAEAAAIRGRLGA